MLGRFLSTEEWRTIDIDLNLAVWYGPSVAQSGAVIEAIKKLANWMKKEGIESLE